MRLIAYTVSGLISGILVENAIAAFDLFEHLGWGIQFGPGVVFGLLFATTDIFLSEENDGRSKYEPVKYVVLMTLASTVIYFGAFQIAIGIYFQSNNSYWVRLAAGGLAGLFGAGALSIITKPLTGTQINVYDEILTTLGGTIAGVVFFSSSIILSEFIDWSLRFIIWQVTVGGLLSRSIRRNMGTVTANGGAGNLA
jgi:hypothetical protein